MHDPETINFDYDQEACDRFAFHLEAVLAVCRAQTRAHGPIYGEHYARSIADQVIAAGQDDGHH